MAEKKKTLSFNQIRTNSIMAMRKDFIENENLSDSEAYKKAVIIESYTSGANYKKGNIYKGDDKLILKFLPERAKKIKKKTSILSKEN